MLSVIVPFYNTKKEYFDPCMKSLLSGKLEDYEILVVDDGSSQEYRPVFMAYQDEPRVRIIANPHAGVSKARNTGILEAKGEWITFVDSDDYVETDYVRTILFLTEDSDADMIFFNGYGKREGGVFKNHFILKEGVDYGSAQELKNSVMASALSLGRVPEYCKCLFTLGSPVTKAIRRDFLIRENIFFNEDVRFAEDTLFSLIALQKAQHIYYKDFYLYYYNINPDSTTGRFRAGLSQDMDVFFARVLAFMQENSLESELKEAYEIRAFLEAGRCIRQEFCHEKNPEPKKEAVKKAVEFLSKEPYHAGIYSNYEYMQLRSCRIAAGLLKKNKPQQYDRMYKLLSEGRKLANRLKRR